MTEQMMQGANKPLPAEPVRITMFYQPEQFDLDLSGFALDPSGAVVDGDDGFVFYNNPEHVSGAISVEQKGAGAASIRLNLGAIPPGIDKVAIVASIDGIKTFNGATGLSWSVGTEREELFTSIPEPDENLTALTIAEVYRRGGGWKIRAVGQGYANGLDGAVVDFGLEIKEEVSAPSAAAPPAFAVPAVTTPPPGFAPPPAATPPAASSPPPFAVPPPAASSAAPPSFAAPPSAVPTPVTPAPSQPQGPSFAMPHQVSGPQSPGPRPITVMKKRLDDLENSLRGGTRHKSYKMAKSAVEAAEHHGIERTTASVFLIMDVSGSMWEEFDGHPSDVTEALQIVAGPASVLDDDGYFPVIEFGSYARVRPEPVSVENAGTYYRGFEPRDGNTLYAPAIDLATEEYFGGSKAYDLANLARPKVGIFFTDDQDWGAPGRAERAFARSSYYPQYILTIGLGNKDFPLLKRLDGPNLNDPMRPALPFGHVDNVDFIPMTQLKQLARDPAMLYHRLFAGFRSWEQTPQAQRMFAGQLTPVPDQLHENLVSLTHPQRSVLPPAPPAPSGRGWRGIFR